MALGRTASASFPALDFARPAMADLSREFAATCAALGVGEGEVTVLDQVDDPRAGANAFRVGASFPLRPPLGAAVLAWAPDPVRDEWLRQVPADTRAHYADALVATHDRGLRGGDLAPPRWPACASWSPCSATTRRPRGVLDRLADELAAHAEFLALQLEPDREYAVNVVNAPVFDHTGHVTARALAHRLRPPAARRRGPRRRATAWSTRPRTLTDALGGPPPPPEHPSVDPRIRRTTDGCSGCGRRQTSEGWWVSRPERSSVPPGGPR